MKTEASQGIALQLPRRADCTFRLSTKFAVADHIHSSPSVGRKSRLSLLSASRGNI